MPPREGAGQADYSQEHARARVRGRSSVQAGGVRADRRELHLDEGLDGAAHVGAVLAGEHADAGMHACQKRTLADAGDDHRVDEVLAESEDRRHAAAVRVRPVGHHADGADLAVDDVDDGEVRAAPEVPGTGGIETAGRLGRNGDAEA